MSRVDRALFVFLAVVVLYWAGQIVRAVVR